MKIYRNMEDLNIEMFKSFQSYINVHVFLTSDYQ